MRNLSAASILALSCLSAPLARADVVGNVGAVNQAAQGTPPGGAARALSLGAGVVDKERIDTKADGKAQIVFLDKSTLGVGANSSVTINHFIYDPQAGAGKQSVSIAKGALRFIGGEVSHGSGMDIKTPSASIGVRGGALMVRVGGPEGDEIVLLNGVATIVTATGETVELTRPGYGVVVARGGGKISEPALASAATVESFDQQFSSSPGQTAGANAAALPSDAQATARLGDFRAADHTPWAGLGAIGAHWSGAGIAQSRAQTNNQTVATKTQQTVAAIVAANKPPTTNNVPPVVPVNPTSPGALGPGTLFAHGFCVWGCVTPTLVSSTSNQSGGGTATFQAAFPGHGYFLITFSFNSDSFTSGGATSTANSGTFRGTLGASVAYHPASGGPIETNTYNIAVNETYSWQGVITGSSGPTSWTASGSDTLYFVNANNIVLSPPATSSNSFFSLPNGFSETFDISYPK